MEMQQMRTIRRRTLGKDRNIASSFEQIGNFLVDDAGVAATAAAQENGIVLRRQPADQRPVPYLFLGNEGGRQGRIDHVNVDPGDMVGDEQGTGLRMPEVSLDFDPEAGEQGNRPTGLEAFPHRIGTPRENAQNDQSPAEDQQGQAKNPEGANQGVGLVQSACPR